MDHTVVNPTSLAKPVGFNHGILAEGGRVLFVAGQPGLDPAGNVVAKGDIVAQFAQAFANLNTVIEAAGGTAIDLVKLTIYVTDNAGYVASRKAIGQVYRTHFGRHYPAVTLVEVKGLFDEGALVELDGIAVIRG